MKTVLKITLGIILGFTVLIGGCAALIGGAVNEVQKDSDKTAITLEQYRSVDVGQDTREAVMARLGEPSSSNEVEVEGFTANEPYGSECVYYNQKGQILSIYQFCFDTGTGKLQSKVSI
jgi:hypothetical protein